MQLLKTTFSNKLKYKEQFSNFYMFQTLFISEPIESMFQVYYQFNPKINKAVSIVVWTINNNIARIYTVETIHEYRKIGLATELLKEVEKDCTEQEVTSIQLSSLPSSINLYKKLGFIESNSNLRSKQDYLVHNVTEMHKTLEIKNNQCELRF